MLKHVKNEDQIIHGRIRRIQRSSYNTTTMLQFELMSEAQLEEASADFIGRRLKRLARRRGKGNPTGGNNGSQCNIRNKQQQNRFLKLSLEHPGANPLAALPSTTTSPFMQTQQAPLYPPPPEEEEEREVATTIDETTIDHAPIPIFSMEATADTLLHTDSAASAIEAGGRRSSGIVSTTAANANDGDNNISKKSILGGGGVAASTLEVPAGTTSEPVIVSKKFADMFTPEDHTFFKELQQDLLRASTMQQRYNQPLKQKTLEMKDFFEKKESDANKEIFDEEKKKIKLKAAFEATGRVEGEVAFEGSGRVGRVEYSTAGDVERLRYAANSKKFMQSIELHDNWGEITQGFGLHAYYSKRERRHTVLAGNRRGGVGMRERRQSLRGGVAAGHHRRRPRCGAPRGCRRLHEISEEELYMQDFLRRNLGSISGLSTLAERGENSPIEEGDSLLLRRTSVLKGGASTSMGAASMATPSLATGTAGATGVGTTGATGATTGVGTTGATQNKTKYQRRNTCHYSRNKKKDGDGSPGDGSPALDGSHIPTTGTGTKDEKTTTSYRSRKTDLPRRMTGDHFTASASSAASSSSNSHQHFAYGYPRSGDYTSNPLAYQQPATVRHHTHHIHHTSATCSSINTKVQKGYMKRNTIRVRGSDMVPSTSEFFGPETMWFSTRRPVDDDWCDIDIDTSSQESDEDRQEEDSFHSFHHHHSMNKRSSHTRNNGGIGGGGGVNTLSKLFSHDNSDFLTLKNELLKKGPSGGEKGWDTPRPTKTPKGTKSMQNRCVIGNTIPDSDDDDDKDEFDFFALREKQRTADSGEGEGEPCCEQD